MTSFVQSGSTFSCNLKNKTSNHVQVGARPITVYKLSSDIVGFYFFIVEHRQNIYNVPIISIISF